MSKNTFVYGGLLVASLAGAWVRWTREPEPDIGDKVVMLQGDKDKIETIKWVGKKDEALIERKSDAEGDYLWVTYTKMVPKTKKHDQEKIPKPPPSEGEPGEAEEPAPEMVKQVKVFKAGGAGDKLLDSLSPMLAIRKLDPADLTGDKLTTTGLDDPKEFLEITRKGRTTKLEVGGEVYGTRDRYVRNPATGEIFLVDNELLRPLKYARTRLPDRTLWSIKRKDAVSAVITGASGETVELDQKNIDDQSKAKWVRAATPDEPDEQLKTWMDKALKLKGSSYADPDKPPEDLQLRFKLTLRNAKGHSETLDVLQEGADGDWWGRSEHTRGLVKLLRGPTSELADDVETVISE